MVKDKYGLDTSEVELDTSGVEEKEIVIFGYYLKHAHTIPQNKYDLHVDDDDDDEALSLSSCSESSDEMLFVFIASIDDDDVQRRRRKKKTTTTSTEFFSS